MADTQVGEHVDLPASISGAVASVWKKYAGERPASVDTVIAGTRISCVLKDAVHDFDDGLAAAEEDEDARPLTSSTFRNDAIDAVTRATRRRVMAFVSKHDAKSDVATEVFILDRPPQRLERAFRDHRAV